MTSEKKDEHTINILHFIYYFVAKYNLILNPLLKNAFMGQAVHYMYTNGFITGLHSSVV